MALDINKIIMEAIDSTKNGELEVVEEAGVHDTTGGADFGRNMTKSERESRTS